MTYCHLWLKHRYLVYYSLWFYVVCCFLGRAFGVMA
jgi:hypothetical protein